MNKKNNHLSYQNLKSFLKDKHQLTESEVSEIKEHIDNCCLCWKTWNMVRWDAAAESGVVKELEDYLGPKFIPYYDSSWALAYEWYQQSPNNKKQIENFYKNTNNYIYNSLIFDASGDREDLSQIYKTIKDEYQVESILDFGCGVGVDGLKMIDLGLDVSFADISQANLNFLKWRLDKRKLPSKVIDLNSNFENPKTDAIWCVDVLEHMTDPYEIFKFFSEKTKLFVYFIDDDSENGGRHPFHFKFNHDLFSEHIKNLGFSHKSIKGAHFWIRDN